MCLIILSIVVVGCTSEPKEAKSTKQIEDAVEKYMQREYNTKINIKEVNQDPEIQTVFIVAEPKQGEKFEFNLKYDKVDKAITYDNYEGRKASFHAQQEVDKKIKKADDLLKEHGFRIESKDSNKEKYFVSACKSDSSTCTNFLYVRVSKNVEKNLESTTKEEKTKKLKEEVKWILDMLKQQNITEIQGLRVYSGKFERLDICLSEQSGIDQFMQTGKSTFCSKP